REFVLETDDGDDGRSHDQCVWADALVKFADGSSRYVDAIPMDPARKNGSNAPLSFLYDGKPSDGLLADWQYDRTSTPGKDGPREVITYKDPQTGLVVEVRVVRYAAFPAVDWVCWLSNTGSSETPILSDFLPLDSALLTGDVPDGAALLRWSNGDGCTESSFLPHDEPLQKGTLRQFAATSSNTTCLPFFNLKGPEGGWILAVGWTGRWKAEFLHEPAGPVVVRAGMQSTRFRLRPGEKVRTPRMVMLRYTGDRMIDGHNAFRRLMLAHYVPQEGGKPAIPPVAANNVAGLWLRKARTKKPLELLNEAGELALIPRAAAMGCEAYWMDAYWFPQPWYNGNIGNWHPRKDDFPRGLRPLADAAHQHGLKMILWFAPLHVNPGTQWANDYPQFIHSAGGNQGGLWKLGDPEARETLVRWLSERRREWDFDVYREDFGTGIPPEEGPDRIGIAEMKHIEGFYWFWSELKRRNPGLLIDNCAGGGRRIDIETARLAYCLWRSDFNDVGEGMKDQAHWPMMGRADQVMVSGLSLYYPLNTGPVWDMRPYNFRSAMSPGIVLYTDLESEEFSADSARKGIAELKQLRPYFLGDFYPLLPLSTSQQDWYAYQLDRGDLGEGCVLVFRRPESPEAAQKVRLERIDPNAEYSVSITGETYDLAPATKISGSALEELEVRIDTQPGSTLIRYKRL
ncbi:MAG: alpha-galactosidase, partial [Planctomycetota bacterium]